MKFTLTAITALFLATGLTVMAGTEKSYDISAFTTPIVTAAKSNNTQALAFSTPLMLNHAAASEIFAAGTKNMVITNVPVPPNGTAALHLQLSAPVFDANSQFLWATKDGRKRITVSPIYSYKGSVEGEPGSKVSLHYSEGDLTGFITHADGSRTIVGKASEYRAVDGATPHIFESEGANARPLALSNFTCGSEFLPADEKEAVTSMAMPSSIKNGESIQALTLKELRLAIVLREDIDSVLKLQGLTTEQVAQYFAKIVAAMSQVYEEELGAHMYIGYLLAFTTEEPSGYLYNGREPQKLLNEFSLDWSSGYTDVERTVAHLYCIKRPVGGIYVGGIAYGGQSGSRLCNTGHQGGYGVSTLDLYNGQNIPGDANSRNAFVWDVYVATHEIGHNVGAAHTHSCYWSPPVDTCQLISDGTDACYNSPDLRRVRPGTIMSYCHLVNGSITPLTFGDRVAERMRTWIDASCMKAVSEPMVRITSPRGHDEWAGGQKVPIKWVSAMVSAVNLDYSRNGESDWVSIAKNLNSADGTYLWTLPAIGGPTFWIRISSSSDANVQNISLASYTINVPLAINSPQGGERLGTGTTFQIRWAKDNSVNSVKILFSSNDGTDWSEVATGQTGQSYTWTVGDVATTTARIKLVSTTNSKIEAISEPFAIGVPSFKLMLPKEGAEICNNFDNQYNWAADFVDRIRIQYSVDDGTTWRNAIQSITVPASQWQIFSRNSGLGSVAVGTKVKLRVLESVSEQVLDTRNELTIAECSGVTGVNDQTVSLNGLTIEKATPNPANGSTLLTIHHSKELMASVVAVDAAGSERVLVQNITLSGAGVSAISISLDTLPQGAYSIVVRGDGVQADIPVRVVR